MITDPRRFLYRDSLDPGGDYAMRTRGEAHMWTPDSISRLQLSTRTNSFATYKEYARLINDQSERLMTLRGLFVIKASNAPTASTTSSKTRRSSSCTASSRKHRKLHPKTEPWL